MIASIIELLAGIFKSIPYFDKWFTKSESQSLEEKKKEVRDIIDEIKKTGRPQD